MGSPVLIYMYRGIHPVFHVFPMFRYGQYSFTNGKYWDSKANPCVSIDSRRLDSARKGQLVGPKEREGYRKGQGRDADILFGMEGKEYQNNCQCQCFCEKLEEH